jgi:hypothetical protein
MPTTIQGEKIGAELEVMKHIGYHRVDEPASMQSDPAGIVD